MLPLSCSTRVRYALSARRFLMVQLYVDATYPTGKGARTSCTSVPLGISVCVGQSFRPTTVIGATTVLCRQRVCVLRTKRGARYDVPVAFFVAIKRVTGAQDGDLFDLENLVNSCEPKIKNQTGFYQRPGDCALLYTMYARHRTTLDTTTWRGQGDWSRNNTERYSIVNHNTS